jgi:acetoin utilization protein AcuB
LQDFRYQSGKSREGWRVRETITIQSVMTRHPYFVDVDANLNSAKVMIKQLKVQHLPVKDGAHIRGVISLKEIQRAEALGLDTSIGCESTVRDVMDNTAYIVEKDLPLAAALQHMADEHLDAALVTDRGLLIGIFTITDACRCYAEMLQPEERKAV